MSACTVCTNDLDPVLQVAGFDTHPACQPPAAQPDDHTRQLRHDLTDAIVDAAATSSRSVQKAIGPSEIGHPCDRRIAYKVLDWPTAQDGGDPLPSIVGTGGHLWLADAFADPRHEGRWLVETPLVIRRPSIRGTGDLFDIRTHTAIDWKFPGATSMAGYRQHGPSQVYRTQVHLYGLGFENAGYRVDRVAIAFLPRGGNLRGSKGMHVWSEPYDRQHALDALDRLDAITLLAAGLDIEHHPDRWQHITATPTYCAWCPWFRPGATDLSTGCPGDSAARAADHAAAAAPFTALIAAHDQQGAQQ